MVFKMKKVLPSVTTEQSNRHFFFSQVQNFIEREAQRHFRKKPQHLRCPYTDMGMGIDTGIADMALHFINLGHRYRHGHHPFFRTFMKYENIIAYIPFYHFICGKVRELEELYKIMDLVRRIC